MIVKYQLQKEMQAENYANNHSEGYVIICDRSAIEPAAYVGKENVSNILAQLGKKFEQIRDSYDLVIHLTTVAKGASEFYTNENKKNRKESISQSISLDDSILQIWSEHSNRVVIENFKNGFDNKLKKVEEVIINYLKDIS